MTILDDVYWEGALTAVLISKMTYFLRFDFLFCKTNTY